MTANANRLRTYKRSVLASVRMSGQQTETFVATQRYEPKREEDMPTVKDVVCGMDIDPNTASAQMEYQGKSYYFCSDACHDKFMAEPQKYAS